MPPTSSARTGAGDSKADGAAAEATGFTSDELQRLFDLLAVPSVSANGGAAADLRRAAELCAAEIQRAGGEIRILETERNPLVVGRVEASTPGPHPRVLIYGHYDVQPPDPVEDWVSPPFEPTIRDGYLHCRGANDDKGQLFALFVGVQRLRAEGRLPVDVTFLVDGEEEIGGTSSATYIGRASELPDVALVFDAPSLTHGKPGLYVASRGIVLVRLHVETGTADAHSGHFGGAALNAVHVLTEILAGLLPRDGKLPGPLTEGTAPPTAEERAAWAQLPTGAEMLSEAGLAPADSTAAAEFYQRTTAAPALDVHSIHAGAPQAKTVVTTRASAFLSIRLAPGQEADRIVDALEALVMDGIPPAASVELVRLVTADPAMTDPDDPMVRRVAEAIAAATGLDPRPGRLGGSVPILAEFSRRGIPAILTGFHDPDDGTHSPNERIALDALNAAVASASAILTALG